MNIVYLATRRFRLSGLAAIIGALFDENSIALLDHTGDTLTDETGA